MMSKEKAASIALWVLAGVLMLLGCTVGDYRLCLASLLVALGAAVLTLSRVLRLHVLLLVHSLALFKGDRPIDTQIGRHAQELIDRVDGQMNDGQAARRGKMIRD